MDNFEYNYDEGVTLAEVEGYIQSTYGEHYAGDREIQVFDFWDSMGILTPMCIGTAIKYLARYGRKDGANRKDLLKAMHYITLALYSEQPEYEGNDLPNLDDYIDEDFGDEKAPTIDGIEIFGDSFPEFLERLTKGK